MPVNDSAPLSMEAFLQQVERRAFHMARMATGHREDALDIVQDTMIKLVNKYSDKQHTEWKPLFYRILNSRIADHHRRRSVRERWMSWTHLFSGSDSEEASDKISQIAGNAADEPDEMLLRQLRMQKLTAAVSDLPSRQQQAFMLRSWEGMSTGETALTMKCSESSVKTHYSRALHSLRESLGDYWYEQN